MPKRKPITMSRQDSEIAAMFRSAGCLTCNGTKKLCGVCGEASNACHCDPDGFSSDTMNCPDCCPEWTMSARTVGHYIGIAPEEWKGRCYEIAGLMLKKKLLQGELCYGIWKGEISPNSHFAGRTVTHHGWIQLPNGKVVDPTRWVFEAIDPYIFCGDSDEYDFGGDEFRANMNGTCPAFKKSEEAFDLVSLPKAARRLVANLTNSNGTLLSTGQMFWLANCDPKTFGKHAKSIYKWFTSAGQDALLPIDSRTRILGRS